MKEEAFKIFLDNLRTEVKEYKSNRMAKVFILNRLREALEESAGKENEQSFTATQIQRVFDLREEERSWVVKYADDSTRGIFGTREQAECYAKRYSQLPFKLI
jgi:hypothetical protein